MEYTIQTESMAEPATPAPESCVVVIFGATGDLTYRELIPSLFALHCIGLLPQPFAIIGYARRDWDDAYIRNHMHDSVIKWQCFSEEKWQFFASHLYYIQGNFSDDPSDGYTRLREKIQSVREEHQIPDNVLFHLSTPPVAYADIFKRLKPAGLSQSDSGFRRVIIEKPFGQSYETARDLDREILKVFDEKQVYRVDHYLGKDTVQNMLVFRFANPSYEPIWNRNYIDHVQITVSEQLGIGTRANFYEKTGILRDMVQNHLLQLLCMAALEPPVNYDASLRVETLKVLESICPVNVERDVVLGQYDAGEMNGEPVVSYQDEKNVQTGSMTPTFAAIRLHIHNWRWAGVPFYLRTGKRLKTKLTEVSIHFKPTPHLMFPPAGDAKKMSNVLKFRLQPNEGIIYTFFAKPPGADILLKPVTMNFEYKESFQVADQPSAYQWLIFDAMRGDQTMFPNSRWIQKAWSIIDPVIEQWETAPWTTFPNYASGTWGPEAADKLLRRSRHVWQNEL